MTEVMTRITVPGAPMGHGLMNYGRIEPSDMIAQFRAMAADYRKKAEAIEQAADEHFQIDVVRGVHIQRPVETVQQSSIRAESDRG